MSAHEPGPRATGWCADGGPLPPPLSGQGFTIHEKICHGIQTPRFEPILGAPERARRGRGAAEDGSPRGPSLPHPPCLCQRRRPGGRDGRDSLNNLQTLSVPGHGLITALSRPYHGLITALLRSCHDLVPVCLGPPPRAAGASSRPKPERRRQAEPSRPGKPLGEPGEGRYAGR